MSDGLDLPGFDSAHPERVALVTEAGSFTGADLDRRAREHVSAWRDARIVGLCAAPDANALAAAIAAARTGTPLVLLPPAPAADLLAALDDRIAPDWIVGGSGEGPRPSRSTAALPPGTVVITTSGTGGVPKIVRHTWSSLGRPVRVRPDLSGSVWLLTYPYHLYAGMQVVLHAWLNRGTLVPLPESREPDAIVSLAARARVTHISGTPSFFRRLLMLPDRARLASLPLAQITLGGERATQPVLDALRTTFPGARVVHLYATTELGRCFAIEDGREGFPAAMLAAPTRDGVSLRIRGDELEVRPAGSHGAVLTADAPAESEWIPTGDLVEVRGDRVTFLGRRTDFINVGGNKVNPHRVEEVLRRFENVRDVRVYGRASALVGQLVAADVVVEGIDVELARARIQRLADEQLSEAERPRFLKFVERIELSAAGKTVRREDER